MEAQGVPVTIANLAIHRHREEEMNRERMRHNQTVQEAASQRAREANKGKAREVVPDSEEEESEEMYSSPSEEWQPPLQDHPADQLPQPETSAAPSAPAQYSLEPTMHDIMS
ncbi:hypothetical protein PIB30_079816 [Stylosanthes scabra]|uniref:Uncharacterized protein n=1 Tax=Stylosanthes scabra TaxID=79078 RepID=A0ABU6SS28_9FABA|nr:hypothetical protein [Stylosanthes scabra]